MHPEQSVHQMVEEVLQRQAKVVLERSGCSPQEALERVMNLGENRIDMRISRSAWFPRDLCFPHS
jgi:hypothetical protein